MGTSITAADNSLSGEMQTTYDMEAKSEVEAEGIVAENSTPEESQNSETEEPAEWVAGFRLFVLVSVLSLVMFLVLLDSSIIGTATPEISTQFDSLSDVGWYGAAYQLASASLQPVTGKIYSVFNAKWIFLSFFAIFELGSLLCGVATSSNMLIVGRAVAGLGSTGLQNGGLTIIARSLPVEKRAAYTGILIGISQFGTVAGPLLGGALTSYATWRWCFYINLPIGAVVALGLLFIQLPNKHIPGNRSFSALVKNLDFGGIILFVGFMVELFFALQWGGTTYPWASSTVIGLFCGAGATFIVFLVWQIFKADQALIPLSLVKKKTVWASCLVYGLTMAGLFLCTYYLPIYFQSVKGATPMLSGVYLLPLIVSQLSSVLISGWLVGRLGYYFPFSFSSSVITTIGNGLISTFSTGTSVGQWIGYQILLGVGRGIGIQMPVVAVQNSLPQSQIPMAMALLIFTQNFMSSVCLTVANTILDSGLDTLLSGSSVNAETVMDVGATGIRSAFSGADLNEVLTAYATSIDYIFYLATGLSGLSLVFVLWGMGWRDVRRNRRTGASQR